MDAQVLVLTADAQLGELIKAQVDNLGCAGSVVTSYEGAASRLDWADALVIDLVGSGLADLRRLRTHAPALPVLAIAPNESRRARARSAGAQQVLVEPFSISDLVDGVKKLAAEGSPRVIDLDAKARSAPVADEMPWWATR